MSVSFMPRSFSSTSRFLAYSWRRDFWRVFQEVRLERVESMSRRIAEAEEEGVEEGEEQAPIS